MAFECGRHRAFVYMRGGVTPVGELTPISEVRWNRKRDDISDAFVAVPTAQCCDLLSELRVIRHELHIERSVDGETWVKVWQGPITRLEYEWEQVGVYAHDVLWQATRTVITTGYDNRYPNIGDVIERMDWLMREQCFAQNGDPWKVVPHLHPITHPGLAPRTSRMVNRYQFYVWEDFDKYAEDYGTDYTVVNRDIYYWDIHLAWKVIPDLDEDYLSQFPRVVEYGSQVRTRGYVTNGHGEAGIAEGNPTQQNDYGIVDHLIVNENDGHRNPTAEEVAGWANTAARNISGHAPAPLSIVIPANTTLMPGAPWDLDDLIPGAWFQASVTRMCRTVNEWQRIHEVAVTELAPDGETVNFTAISAPSTMVIP